MVIFALYLYAGQTQEMVAGEEFDRLDWDRFADLTRQIRKVRGRDVGIVACAYVGVLRVPRWCISFLFW